MATEKRFERIYGDVEVICIDHNKPLNDDERFIDDEDYDKFVDLLNELNDENQHIKQTITDMIQTERTELGKSILKQLWSRIQ